MSDLSLNKMQPASSFTNSLNAPATNLNSQDPAPETQVNNSSLINIPEIPIENRECKQVNDNVHTDDQHTASPFLKILDKLVVEYDIYNTEYRPNKTKTNYLNDLESLATELENVYLNEEYSEDILQICNKIIQFLPELEAKEKNKFFATLNKIFFHIIEYCTDKVLNFLINLLKSEYNKAMLMIDFNAEECTIDNNLLELINRITDKKCDHRVVDIIQQYVDGVKRCFNSTNIEKNKDLANYHVKKIVDIIAKDNVSEEAEEKIKNCILQNKQISDRFKVLFEDELTYNDISVPPYKLTNQVSKPRIRDKIDRQGDNEVRLKYPLDKNSNKNNKANKLYHQVLEQEKQRDNNALALMEQSTPNMQNDPRLEGVLTSKSAGRENIANVDDSTSQENLEIAKEHYKQLELLLADLGNEYSSGQQFNLEDSFNDVKNLYERLKLNNTTLNNETINNLVTLCITICNKQHKMHNIDDANKIQLINLFAEINKVFSVVLSSCEEDSYNEVLKGVSSLLKGKHADGIFIIGIDTNNKRLTDSNILDLLSYLSTVIEDKDSILKTLTIPMEKIKKIMSSKNTSIVSMGLYASKLAKILDNLDEKLKKDAVEYIMEDKNILDQYKVLFEDELLKYKISTPEYKTRNPKEEIRASLKQENYSGFTQDNRLNVLEKETKKQQDLAEEELLELELADMSNDDGNRNISKSDSIVEISDTQNKSLHQPLSNNITEHNTKASEGIDQEDTELDEIFDNLSKSSSFERIILEADNQDDFFNLLDKLEPQSKDKNQKDEYHTGLKKLSCLADEIYPSKEEVKRMLNIWENMLNNVSSEEYQQLSPKCNKIAANIIGDYPDEVTKLLKASLAEKYSEHIYVRNNKVYNNLLDLLGLFIKQGMSNQAIEILTMKPVITEIKKSLQKNNTDIRIAYFYAKKIAPIVSESSVNEEKQQQTAEIFLKDKHISTKFKDLFDKILEQCNVITDYIPSGKHDVKRLVERAAESRLKEMNKITVKSDPNNPINFNYMAARSQREKLATGVVDDPQETEQNLPPNNNITRAEIEKKVDGDTTLKNIDNSTEETRRNSNDILAGNNFLNDEVTSTDNGTAKNLQSSSNTASTTVQFTNETSYKDLTTAQQMTLNEINEEIIEELEDQPEEVSIPNISNKLNTKYTCYCQGNILKYITLREIIKDILSRCGTLKIIQDSIGNQIQDVIFNSEFIQQKKQQQTDLFNIREKEKVLNNQEQTLDATKPTASTTDQVTNDIGNQIKNVISNPEFTKQKKQQQTDLFNISENEKEKVLNNQEQTLDATKPTASTMDQVTNETSFHDLTADQKRKLHQINDTIKDELDNLRSILLQNNIDLKSDIKLRSERQDRSIHNETLQDAILLNILSRRTASQYKSIGYNDIDYCDKIYNSTFIKNKLQEQTDFINNPTVENVSSDDKLTAASVADSSEQLPSIENIEQSKQLSPNNTSNRKVDSETLTEDKETEDKDAAVSTGGYIPNDLQANSGTVEVEFTEKKRVLTASDEITKATPSVVRKSNVNTIASNTNTSNSNQSNRAKLNDNKVVISNSNDQPKIQADASNSSRQLQSPDTHGKSTITNANNQGQDSKNDIHKGSQAVDTDEAKETALNKQGDIPNTAEPKTPTTAKVTDEISNENLKKKLKQKLSTKNKTTADQMQKQEQAPLTKNYTRTTIPQDIEPCDLYKKNGFIKALDNLKTNSIANIDKYFQDYQTLNGQLVYIYPTKQHAKSILNECKEIIANVRLNEKTRKLFYEINKTLTYLASDYSEDVGKLLVSQSNNLDKLAGYYQNVNNGAIHGNMLGLLNKLAKNNRIDDATYVLKNSHLLKNIRDDLQTKNTEARKAIFYATRISDFISQGYLQPRDKQDILDIFIKDPNVSVKFKDVLESKLLDNSVDIKYRRNTNNGDAIIMQARYKPKLEEANPITLQQNSENIENQRYLEAISAQKKHQRDISSNNQEQELDKFANPSITRRNTTSEIPSSNKQLKVPASASNSSSQRQRSEKKEKSEATNTAKQAQIADKKTQKAKVADTDKKSTTDDTDKPIKVSSTNKLSDHPVVANRNADAIALSSSSPKATVKPDTSATIVNDTRIEDTTQCPLYQRNHFIQVLEGYQLNSISDTKRYFEILNTQLGDIHLIKQHADSVLKRCAYVINKVPFNKDTVGLFNEVNKTLGYLASNGYSEDVTKSLVNNDKNIDKLSKCYIDYNSGVIHGNMLDMVAKLAKPNSISDVINILKQSGVIQNIKDNLQTKKTDPRVAVFYATKVSNLISQDGFKREDKQQLVDAFIRDQNVSEKFKDVLESKLLDNNVQIKYRPSINNAETTIMRAKNKTKLREANPITLKNNYEGIKNREYQRAIDMQRQHQENILIKNQEHKLDKAKDLITKSGKGMQMDDYVQLQLNEPGHGIQTIKLRDCIKQLINPQGAKCRFLANSNSKDIKDDVLGSDLVKQFRRDRENSDAILATSSSNNQPTAQASASTSSSKKVKRTKQKEKSGASNTTRKAPSTEKNTQEASQAQDTDKTAATNDATEVASVDTKDAVDAVDAVDLSDNLKSEFDHTTSLYKDVINTPNDTFVAMPQMFYHFAQLKNDYDKVYALIKNKNLIDKSFATTDYRTACHCLDLLGEIAASDTTSAATKDDLFKLIPVIRENHLKGMHVPEYVIGSWWNVVDCFVKDKHQQVANMVDDLDKDSFLFKTTVNKHETSNNYFKVFTNLSYHGHDNLIFNKIKSVRRRLIDNELSILDKCPMEMGVYTYHISSLINSLTDEDHIKKTVDMFTGGGILSGSVDIPKVLRYSILKELDNSNNIKVRNIVHLDTPRDGKFASKTDEVAKELNDYKKVLVHNKKPKAVYNNEPNILNIKEQQFLNNMIDATSKTDNLEIPARYLEQLVKKPQLQQKILNNMHVSSNDELNDVVKLLAFSKETSNMPVMAISKLLNNMQQQETYQLATPTRSPIINAAITRQNDAFGMMRYYKQLSIKQQFVDEMEQIARSNWNTAIAKICNKHMNNPRISIDTSFPKQLRNLVSETCNEFFNIHGDLIEQAGDLQLDATRSNDNLINSINKDIKSKLLAEITPDIRTKMHTDKNAIYNKLQEQATHQYKTITDKLQNDITDKFKEKQQAINDNALKEITNRMFNKMQSRTEPSIRAQAMDGVGAMAAAKIAKHLEDKIEETMKPQRDKLHEEVNRKVKDQIKHQEECMKDHVKQATERASLMVNEVANTVLKDELEKIAKKKSEKESAREAERVAKEKESEALRAKEKTKKIENENNNSGSDSRIKVDEIKNIYNTKADHLPRSKCIIVAVGA